MKKLLFTLLTIAVINTVNCQTIAPGLDIIGKGYDIFKEYARNESMKDYSILDFSKGTMKETPYGFKVPSFVIIQNISTHNIKSASGSSKRDYSQSLATNIDLKVPAFVFSGSVNAQFNKESSQNEQYFYYTLMDANTKWKISIDERTFKSCLDDLFVQDLENPNLKPEELFNRYGTHYIKSAYIGGRIDFTTKTLIEGGFTTNGAEIHAKVRYGAIKGSIDNTIKQSEEFDSKNTSEELKTIGGNSEYVNNINDPNQYQKWADGIKDQPVLCDFEKGSLVPIWELCTNETRKLELKNYFENVIVKSNPLPVKQELKATMAKFEVTFKYISVINDCENTLTRGGEFYYQFKVNDVVVINEINSSNFGYKPGDIIELNKSYVTPQLPIKENSFLKIKGYIKEKDLPVSPDDELGPDFNIQIPVNDSPIDESVKEYVFLKEPPYDYCKVILYYQIKKTK